MLKGIIAIVLKPQYIFDYSGLYITFFIIGFLADIAMTIICYMCIFKQKYIELSRFGGYNRRIKYTKGALVMRIEITPFGLFNRAAADGGIFQAEIIDFLVAGTVPRGRRP